MDRWIAYYTACFLGLLLGGVKQVEAQESRTYSIEDCINLALKNNVDARNSALDVDNARLAYRNSFGQKIPSLSLNGSQSVNAGYTVDPYTNQFVNQTIFSNNFSIFSNVTLFAGNQINYTHSRLKSVWNASQYSQSITNNQITLEVAQYYTSVLSAYKVEAATKSRLDKVNKDRERVKRRIEAKAAAKSDIADVDAQVATEELNLSRASGDIVRQKLLLAQRMLIKDVNFEIVIPNVDVLLSQAPDTNIQIVYDAALSNLPDTKLAKQNVTSNRFNEKYAKGSYFPTLNASGSVNTGYSSARTQIVSISSGTPQDDITFLDINGRAITIPASLIQNQTRSVYAEKYPFKNQFSDNITRGLTVQASIPILNRLVTKNNIDNARIQRLKSQNEVERTNQVIYNNVALAITEYKIAKSNLESAKKQLNSLQTALQSAQIRQESGAGSTFDLLTQQQLFAASQANLVQTQFELVFRKLIIDYYMGQPIKL